MGEVAVEEKLRILAGQLYAAAGIGMWCFSRSRHLFYSTSHNQEKLQAFLELSDCWDYIFGREKGWEKPLIVNDALHMIWIAEDVINGSNVCYTILIGPVFPGMVSVRQIEENLRKRESSIYMQRQLLRILSGVPVQSIEVIRQYARMLHYTLTEESICAGDIYLQEQKMPAAEPELDLEEKEQETVSAERMLQNETVLLKAVKEGNLDYQEIIGTELKGNSMYLSATGDILRDGKNTLLMFGTLCNRSAVEGGLSVHLVHEMEQKNVKEIESCRTTTQLMKLHQKILGNYVREVHAASENTQISKAVRDACGYMKAHILEMPDMEEIAACVGYTPYYFSKKFYKEMGVRVTDYIKTARIEYAKIMLLTTEKSIQEISDLLHFGTRSYFGKVFQEIVGVSPVNYREQALGKVEE